MAIVLDGAALAQQVKSEVRARVQALASLGIQPGLAVIKVGDDPASSVYVKTKRRVCEQLGLVSFASDLPPETTESAIIDLIQRLNEDTSVHGVLLQLPLPNRLRPERILDALSPHKDVDGLHVVNAGALACAREGFVPCTPLGIMRLLQAYAVPLRGEPAIVIGRSQLVGKPMAQLLLGADATVTIAHSRSRDVAELVRNARVVIAAAGQPRLVRGNWIQDGTAVVDVGIHRQPDGSLAGDVEAREVEQRAGWLSPVPGGVGPMTVAMLMHNAVLAAERQSKGTDSNVETSN